MVGQEINANFFVHDDTKKVDLKITGATNIDCEAENFTLDASGNIALPDDSKAGDCIHDSLQKYKLKIVSIKWNSSADTITLKLKLGFIPIEFDLSHVGMDASLYSSWLKS